MKKNVLRKIVIAAFVVAAMSSVSLATIVEYNTTFSSAGSISGWYNFTGSPVISHLDNTVAQYDWTDNDLLAVQTALNYGDPIPSGGSATGDGVVADGAMVFNVQNATRGDERIAYNLGGTIGNGEELTFIYHVFNNVNYWHTFTGYFYDLTDGVQLTPDTWVSCLATADAKYVPVTAIVTYIGTAETAGHEIAIVFREWCSAATRDASVDGVSVTSIPEPATMVLLGLGSMILIRKKR